MELGSYFVSARTNKRHHPQGSLDLKDYQESDLYNDSAEIPHEIARNLVWNFRQKTESMRF
jgi:hypothetical protein